MEILDPATNFAKVTASTGYAAGATSIVLESGDGALLPTTAEGDFNLVYWCSSDYYDPADDPDKEIIRVTARSTDTLTVTRGQEGTSAADHNTGGKTYQLILAVTEKMINDIDTNLHKVKISATDTAPDSLEGKLADNYRVDISKVSSVGDETLLLGVNRQIFGDKRFMQILAHDVSPVYLAEVGLPFSIVYNGSVIYFGFKDADGMWFVAITDTTTDYYAGVAGDSGAYKEWQPEFCTLIKTGKDIMPIPDPPNPDIATSRTWIGLFDKAPMSSADPATTNIAGFRFDCATDGASGNWQAVLKDGTTANVIDTGVAVVAETAYKFYIKTNGTSFYFYIDDVLVATSSTNAPTASTELFPYVVTTNLFALPTVGAQLIEMSKIQLLYDVPR